jgi:xanthine dehydrogenase accessory factor
VEYRIHLEAAPQLVIVGAGHISRVLASMCVPLGFGVQVIDDRADYANSDRFGPPVETTVGDISATLEGWPVGPNTYIVIVTRGHKHDEAALQAVLGRPAKYIGMIGSRRKIDVVFDDLRHGGATDAQLSGVHAPIGVDIGAVSTVEIALSICAELVSVRRAGQPRVVEGPIPIEDASA